MSIIIIDRISFVLFKRWDPNKLLPKQDFDRKVAEADAYLQLLIDQIKLIEQKQQSVPEGDETNEQRYEEILKQANAMLNSVKHMIVQLQIAKVFFFLIKCKNKKIKLIPKLLISNFNYLFCFSSFSQRNKKVKSRIINNNKLKI